MMLAWLAEWTLRSTALGAAAGLALAVFNPRRPQVRMTAWSVVLGVTLALPGLTPWMKLRLQVAPPPPVIVARLAPLLTRPSSALPSPPAARPPLPAPRSIRRALAHPEAAWRAGSILYFGIAGVLLLRLFAGFIRAWRIAARARPAQDAVIEAAAPWIKVRVSEALATPATFASTVLLPPTYRTWNAAKLQAVLLHEGSHAAQGDFYVLLLAAINRAVFWFNPYSWWLARRLAELAEQVSDDAAIAELGDRFAYASILLDMARAPESVPIILAMAGRSQVVRRIERILAMTQAPAGLAPRQRLATAAALLPLAALSAGGIIRTTVAPRPVRTAAAGQDLVMTRNATQAAKAHAGLATIAPLGRRRLAPRIAAPGGVEIAGRAPADPAMDPSPPNSGLTGDMVMKVPGQASARTEGAGPRDLAAGLLRARTPMRAERFKDQSPMPGGSGLLLRTLIALQQGALESEVTSPQLATRLAKQMFQMTGMLNALGAIEAVAFAGVGPGDYDIYNVRFARGVAEARIKVKAGGQLEDLAFRAEGDGEQGGVSPCAPTPSAASSSDAVPIDVSISNRSGGPVQLYGLDPAGRRTLRGLIDDGGILRVATNVNEPLVITDGAGQCREIVRPGQATRITVVTPPDATPTARTTPTPGAVEALRRYIERVRTGQFDDDQLAPQAAALVARRVGNQRAILGALGALRTVSFRGVAPTGEDLYEARFTHGSAEWRIALADGGQIATIALGP